ncbi:MAG TPA: large conductance mechanosensitive channel protein MscL, partial [Planctomycetota bacterium]|nr:large conductance mechanosensitive channel protein MscL [Planctomycetota bacterium]
MGFLKEFKDFAIRGNVVDMAVGIVIGAAFGKIVSSFVSDVLMPPIGIALGQADFRSYALTLKEASVGADGAAVAAVTLNWGVFASTVLDFVLIAFAIFLVVKAMNAAKRKA